MRILATIILFSIAQFVLGQDLKSDSLTFQRNLDKFINREFSTLTFSSDLTQLEAKCGTPLNSLGKCLVVFTGGELDKDGIKSLTIRIQEIATKFFEEGTPVYLSLGGSRSADWTSEQNKKEHPGNLTFVSLGNYCVVGKGEREFETIFNKQTLKLHGVESVQ